MTNTNYFSRDNTESKKWYRMDWSYIDKATPVRTGSTTIPFQKTVLESDNDFYNKYKGTMSEHELNYQLYNSHNYDWSAKVIKTESTIKTSAKNQLLENICNTFKINNDNVCLKDTFKLYANKSIVKALVYKFGVSLTKAKLLAKSKGGKIVIGTGATKTYSHNPNITLNYDHIVRVTKKQYYRYLNTRDMRGDNQTINDSDSDKDMVFDGKELERVSDRSKYSDSSETNDYRLNDCINETYVRLLESNSRLEGLTVESKEYWKAISTVAITGVMEVMKPIAPTDSNIQDIEKKLPAQVFTPTTDYYSTSDWSVVV